ncbi:MAG: cytochrome C oxidase subunit IV family protein [Fimbriimonadaceae bacterium]
MAGHDETHSSGEHHVHPISMYIKVMLILTVGMVLTIWASYIHVGAQGSSLWNNVIAVSIALAKTAFVVLFFMHVRYGTKLIKMWAAAGFVWFLLMFLILADYVTRPWEPVEGWERIPATALPRGQKPDPANPDGPGYGSYAQPDAPASALGPSGP